MRKDPASVYRELGVRPVITASGATTAYGGSKLRPEVMEAMNSAATVMVEIDELNRAAGEVIAELTGAEAGFVSSRADSCSRRPRAWRVPIPSRWCSCPMPPA